MHINSNNNTSSGLKIIQVKNKRDINDSENNKNYSPRIPKSGPLKKKSMKFQIKRQIKKKKKILEKKNYKNQNQMIIIKN